MIKRTIEFGTLFLVFLSIAGCTVQQTADGGMAVHSESIAQLIGQNPASGQVSPVGGSITDQQLANITAKRLGTDQKNGGIIGVQSDVQHCYAALAGGPDLKRCVALDMAAKYVDDAMSRQFHISGEPYFSNAAWVSRMRRYATPAFGSKKAAMGFMDTYDAQMMNNSLRYR
jgi:hypothetical protein